MAQISTNEFKAGVKVEMEGQPYTIVSNEFVKPGKGQAFVKFKLKKQIENSDLTEDQKKKLTEQLDQLKDKLKEMGDKQKEEAKNLEQQVDQMRQDGQQDQADQLQDQLEKMLEQAPQMNKLQDLAAQLGEREL